MGRVLFHIDLNAFYVNAEILRKPSLEGEKIAVGGSIHRGVISCASYAARAFGVRSAMPVSKALECCPDLILLPTDFAWYEATSQRFFEFLRRYSNLIEPASIDEGYIDVTETIKQYQRPLDLAWEIQQSLLNELHLPCSIGVAPNRFLAKMASDMRKPLGITILRMQEVERKLWPMQIDAMYGIGKKSAALLHSKNIHTIGDFANPENERLILQLLGKASISKIQNTRGFDSNQLVLETSIQSISRSTTLLHDTNDSEEAKLILKELCLEVAKKAKEEGIFGKTLSLTIRYCDFSNIVRSVTLPQAVNQFELMYENITHLFDKFYDTDIPLRHLRVNLGSLVSNQKKMDQINLFEKKIIQQKDIVEQLNHQLSSGKLIYASSLLNHKKE